MKKFYQIIFAVLIITNSTLTFSQGFDSVYQLTNGNNDRNPRFNYNHEGGIFPSYQFEMFAFERSLSDSSVHICLQKINKDGAFDSAMYLTPVTPKKNINPSIAYNPPKFPFYTPRYILVVWETNQYGGSNIYGRRYIEGQGWSAEFAIDSSSSRSFTPNVVCMDSTNFAITYRKGNDIVYKGYNILNNTLTSEQNLTPADTFHCFNPYITMQLPLTPGYLIVTYEREINPNKRSICYQYREAYNGSASWSQQDSVSFTGNNRNRGFNDGNIATYETNSPGNWQVMGVNINPMGSNFHQPLFNGTGGDYSNFHGKHFLITDAGGPFGAYGVIEEIVLNWKFAKFYFFSSGPTLQVEMSKVGEEIPLSMTSSNPINNGNCRRFWFVFNYTFSPASQFDSRIYGTWADNCVTSVSQIGSETPQSYSLHQNYPNPFNPETKIRFNIPKSGFVTLEIFNTLGERVDLLVNEELSRGSYEVNFNGANYKSGVYFCRLTAGNFSESRKMILIK